MKGFFAEQLIRGLLVRLGEDPDREGLQETPKRVAEAWKEWTAGMNVDAAGLLKTFEDGAVGYDELVFQGGIPFYSHCEHHLAPFFGVAHVGYIPNGRIVGLSKLARLVDVFAARLQVQERMTRQIACTLQEALGCKAVGVVLRARHLCIESRGIKKPGTATYTSALLGLFKDDVSARAEFMGFVGRADAEAGPR